MAWIVSATMQEKLNNYPAAKDVLLQLHVGLGYGKVVLMNVGGEFGWECVLGYVSFSLILSKKSIDL